MGEGRGVGIDHYVHITPSDAFFRLKTTLETSVTLLCEYENGWLREKGLGEG